MQMTVILRKDDDNKWLMSRIADTRIRNPFVSRADEVYKELLNKENKLTQISKLHTRSV